MDSFRGEFVSTELAMFRAIKAYKKAYALNFIKKGKAYFKTKKEVREFIKESFRGEDLFSGGDGTPYIEGVIICVDKDGDLRNKFIVNENGVYKRLDSIDEDRVYEFLFKNQHRIGKINLMSVEKKEIESEVKKDCEVLPQKADERIIQIMNKITKVIK
ncbi:hypothetical protein F1B92_04545 [Campylobacter sp. FMV-PI01]|uniref:Uncharacterized protein n=1 Tax=Campylobacter portucalensis TaxID=2608384 RepID=A0A6L5WHA8_9BACT|nr:hypothetical protein [Campylobacter portucalensis]MSN96449.1 hypothetical protein [Campylobacter portucalensis]